MKGRATTDQIQVVLNSLAGAGLDISSRPNMASVVWDMVSGTYKHVVITGEKGTAGREIELQKSATHIQWRYVGAALWTNLVSLAEITGPVGPNIVQTGTPTNINGLLKGDGSGVLRAVPGEDYVLPNDPRFSGLATTTIKYPFELNETILKGKPVQLLTTGKLEAVKTISVAKTIPLVAETSSTIANRLVGDPFNANRYLIFKIQGNTSTVVFVTYDPMTETFSEAAPVNIGLDAPSSGVAIVDPVVPNRFVVLYNNNYGYGRIAVCSMVNNIVSVVADNYYASNTHNYDVFCCDTRTANRFVISYSNGSNYPCALAVTLSGSVLSFGAETVLYFDGWYPRSVVSNPMTDSSFLFCFSKISNNNLFVYHANLSVLTFTVTATSSLPFQSQNGMLRFNPTVKGQFLMTCAPSTNSYFGTVIKGNLSDTGTTITWGNQYVYSSYYMNSQGPIPIYDPNNTTKFILAFEDPGTYGYATVIEGLITGEVLSFTSKTLVGWASWAPAVNYAGQEGKFIYTYSTSSNFKRGIGQFPKIASNLDSTKLLGILQKDGDLGSVNEVLISGIDETKTGLTIGKMYYVLEDGSISFSPTPKAVQLGLAISATKLLIKIK